MRISIFRPQVIRIVVALLALAAARSASAQAIPTTSTAPSVASAGPSSSAGESATATLETKTAAAPPTAHESWLDFKLGGLHPFVGITIAAGPALPIPKDSFRRATPIDPTLPSGSPPSAAEVRGTFLFALRGGVLIDRTELGVEVSPMTYFAATDFAPFQNAQQNVQVTDLGPSFQANVFVARYLQLKASNRLYWPLRVGAGIAAGNLPQDHVWIAARVDLVGLLINIGHINVELHAPSFRVATDFVGSLLAWHFGVDTSYVF